MNTYASIFTVDNFTEFRIQMLNWANRFNIFCLLDNQHYDFTTPAFECLLAVGCKRNISLPSGHALESLKDFSVAENEWLFGHLGYDLKNEIEKVYSRHSNGIGFDDLHFFIPDIVIELKDDAVAIYCNGDAATVWDAIRASSTAVPAAQPSVAIKNRMSESEYISAVQQLQQHILMGDCYEINFCQEFFDAHALIDPLAVYHKLISISPNPFAALYKLNDKYCICASPERYLKREAGKVFSQPIKGTSKRNFTSKEADLQNRNYLLENEKEKSENVMVVDLVRNDLSRICKEGSVKVEELFGVYSFPQVHQMISTISGELEPGTHWVDIIKATFPMGSMTGAPKKRVMELIEQYETTKRGLFSGAIGYIKPGKGLPAGEADFDFNVVIRSIFYNATTQYLSFNAGSGITFYSDAAREYDECLMKVAAVMKALE